MQIKAKFVDLKSDWKGIIDAKAILGDSVFYFCIS